MNIHSERETHLAPARKWSPRSMRSFKIGYSVNAQVIRHAAFVRNLNVERLSVEGYRISDGRRIVSFCGPTPDTTSLVARLFSNAKDITKEMLRGAGLSVPDGELFAQHQEDEAWTFATALGVPVVVKPTHGSGGVGVTSDIKSRDHFSLAWKVARDAKTKPIIVEEHICGLDFRLFVIGNHVRAAVWRVPAYVEGDGKTSVEGLIETRIEHAEPIHYSVQSP